MPSINNTLSPEEYISLLNDFLRKRISSSTLGTPLILYGDDCQANFPFSKNLLPFTNDEVENIISRAPSSEVLCEAVSIYYRGEFCPRHAGMTLEEIICGPCPICSRKAFAMKIRLIPYYGLSNIFNMNIRRK